MRIYTVLLTLSVPHTVMIDTVGMMAKTLVLAEKYFKVVESTHHVFDVAAYTHVLILAESHLVVQTYPELGKVFVSLEYHEELHKEGHVDVDKFAAEMVKAFECTTHELTKLER